VVHCRDVHDDTEVVSAMAQHLTPQEIARHFDLERRDVIARCVATGVPIFHGRIDRTLFAYAAATAGRVPVEV
jgi:hypothetical protein